MAGDVTSSYQTLFLEQRHCHFKCLGVNEKLLAWPAIALIELCNHSVFRCHWGTFVKTLVSGTASGGGKRGAKRNFCSTQSVNDSKSTRKISFARLPLVCLYFGVSCELDLCLLGQCRRSFACHLGRCSASVLSSRQCLAVCLYGCYFAIVAPRSFYWSLTNSCPCPLVWTFGCHLTLEN